MPFTLTMPKLSPTMEEGTIAKWHVKEGDFVHEGDVLMEIATDKATVEHSAIDEGYLRKVLIFDGGAAHVNQPIAIFTQTADESIEGYQPEKVIIEEPAAAPEEEQAPAPTEQAPPTVAGAMQQPAFTPEPPLEGYVFGKSDPIF